MRAAVITAPRRIETRDVPLPAPGPGEVRVALEGCGVCGSNLELWRGQPWFDYPLAPGTPGHEAWGRVDAVGDGVEALRPGQRVAMLSERAYAEADVAPADRVVPLDGALAERPFPGEALGCAFNIFARSDVRVGQNVAIVGIGFLGALLTSLARQAGARVIALSRRPFSREIARRMGAAHDVPTEDRYRAVEQVMELTGGAGCERVIEATGRQDALDLATDLTGVRSRLVIAGYHQDGPRQVNMQQWNWRGLDVINAHERDVGVIVGGIRAAADAVASGDLDPDALYTHRFRLDELDEALEDLDRRPDGFLKGYVVP
jgi:2-desacetyl-2-hydroxyethyl bacteriochlorophyllide A dehydrogenase